MSRIGVFHKACFSYPLPPILLQKLPNCSSWFYSWCFTAKIYSQKINQRSFKNGGHHGTALHKMLPWLPISFIVACKILHNWTSGISATSCFLPCPLTWPQPHWTLAGFAGTRFAHTGARTACSSGQLSPVSPGLAPSPPSGLCKMSPHQWSFPWSPHWISNPLHPLLSYFSLQLLSPPDIHFYFFVYCLSSVPDCKLHEDVGFCFIYSLLCSQCLEQCRHIR